MFTMELLLLLFVSFTYFGFLLLAQYGFKGWAFISVDNFVASVNQRFFILPYILGPLSYLILVAYIFDLFNLPIQNIWAIVLIIVIMRILAIVVGSRLSRAPVLWIVIFSFVVSVLAYGIQITAINSIMVGSYNNPVLMVMTIISSLCIYALLNNTRFGDMDDGESYRNAVMTRYVSYTKKYKSIVPRWYKIGSRQYVMLFAIMITEDINRPKAVRFVERVASIFMNVRSTGIMQVSDDSYLSDNQSIKLAARIIQSSYKKHDLYKNDDYHLVRAVAEDYNGAIYADIVSEVYFIIQKDLKY